MIRMLPLVLYYIAYNKGKTVILSVCLTAALFLPLTIHQLVGLLETEMVERAEQTPLVIGPHGSRFDLILHALHLQVEAPGVMRQEERFAIEETGYAEAIPLFVRYRARGAPIVGTSLEYFSFRNLRIAEGRSLTMLGDCVVGWQVAQALGLRPGDRLLSDPENVFDLGGDYPLNMHVAGVLERSDSPDDYAVFVDLNTAWVIAGIGHGHDELNEAEEPEAVLSRTETHVVASPAVQTHTTITPENIHTFHFHGDPADFPLTAVIALPRDSRSGTLLLGRYVGDDSRYQALRPVVVIEELMGMVIRLKRFFDMHHAFMVATTALLVSLVMLLSLRLRRGEMETMFQLGCARATIWKLQTAELLILAGVSLALAVGASRVTLEVAQSWIRTLTG